MFLAYINSKGDSSRRVYDASAGRRVGDILTRQGTYRLAFPEDLTPDAIRLNGHWEGPEIEEWGDELPTPTLDALHRDLDLARLEARTLSHSDADAITAEHPAAPAKGVHVGASVLARSRGCSPFPHQAYSRVRFPHAQED